MKTRAPLLLLAALIVSGMAWAFVRINLESQLAEAAQRDLRTIIDLVAADIAHTAESVPALKGFALARMAIGPRTALGQTLNLTSDQYFRNIYFFDADGRVQEAEQGDGQSSPPTSTRIVRLAIGALAGSAPEQHGTLSDPYPGMQHDEVIGAWRWFPRFEFGIVAERPYERFSKPLEWVDASFAFVLAAFVIAAFIIGLPRPGELLRAFRKPDIRRCGPYRIERLIGEGAMSNVYLARHERLGRLVALKRLKVHAQTDELSARFDREARLASQLSHPNIVSVLDYGKVPEGGFFYTMEYIRGLTLAQWVEQHGPIPPARALHLLRQLCAAVGAMHRAGLLHRDIKPENVMADAAHGEYDRVKLLDFGLIRNLEAGETRDLTSNARALGTPAYMAPERLIDPRSIDPRTDLYGIGCIAFLLLTGRKPFEATQDTDLAQQILHIEAPSAAAHSPFTIPESLDTLVASTLAKKIEQRPESAEALATGLADIAIALPWRADLARLWWESTFPADNAKQSSDRRPA